MRRRAESTGDLTRTVGRRRAPCWVALLATALVGAACSAQGASQTEANAAPVAYGVPSKAGTPTGGSESSGASGMTAGLPVTSGDQAASLVSLPRWLSHRHGGHRHPTTTTTGGTGNGGPSTTASGSTTSSLPGVTTTATTGPVVTAPPPSGNATRIITNADRAALAGGFTVPAGQIWEFAPDQNVTIEAGKNVVVEGLLRMRPNSANVQHLLQFVNINEAAFVGGGMSVLASDVGLWVTGAGQLDLQGSRRAGWTRLSGSVDTGATQITLADAPSGWQVGDQISIAPTGATTSRGFSTQFDERKISAISGKAVTLDAGLSYSHPMVNGKWTAEVMNLTRNVRIEGQGGNGPVPSATNGRGHVFVMSSKPQTIKYIQIRNMGARKGSAGNSNGVLGRYSLHFHHNGDGSRGSIVEGVVVRNSGNSAFVPHASNGIVLRDNIAYDGWENAFWWDPPTSRTDTANNSNDLLLDHDIVASLHTDPAFRGYQLSGFTMATGSNMTIRESVAVGVQGNANANGFRWPEQNNMNPLNVWNFSGNNMAHNNNADGIFVWQNDGNRHVISDFVAYNNGETGIDHGAYTNAYQYKNIQLYGNGQNAVVEHSASIGGGEPRADGYGLAFENLTTDGALWMRLQTLGSNRPILYKNCSFASVIVDNNSDKNNAGYYDFVDCGLDPSKFVFKNPEAGTRIRVQDGSSAYQLDDHGTMTTISPFYG
jgi:hypothetical protein